MGSLRFLWIFFVVSLFVIIAAANPFLASRYMELLQGPFSGKAVQKDGSVSYMVFDIKMKPPGWLSLPPGAIVSESSRTVQSNKAGVSGSLDFAVPMDLPSLKAFFTSSLSAQGFTVKDEGFGVLDPRTASVLGVSGEMSATRPAGEHVYIHFGDEEGWFAKAREVQIGWKSPH